MMDPLWSETCWSIFKYFIILIVSTYYILYISWIIKYLIIIDAQCKHGRFNKISSEVELHPSMSSFTFLVKTEVYCFLFTTQQYFLFTLFVRCKQRCCKQSSSLKHKVHMKNTKKFSLT